MEKRLITLKRWRFLSLETVRRFFVFALASLLTSSAFANPVVDNVAAGTVSIQQTESTTTINQTSSKAIINWQSFNIGAGETTHFQQPTGGVALNRINPQQGVSSIYGHLTATGQIILINPAGIYFGPSAYVNVGGLIATTHNISDTDFLSGNFNFNKVDPYSGSIINEGTIIAAQNGLIALVANNVTNTGLIQAEAGHVILASGDAFTMSFDGNGLVNFAITKSTSSRGVDQNGATLPDGVENTGSLIADAGQVLITAKAASGVLDHAINMRGFVQARSVSNVNGIIILSADPNPTHGNIVHVAGTLDASGIASGQTGGTINITGDDILLDSSANINASGDLSGGNIFIGGNFHGTGPLPNADALVMLAGATINSNAISSGNGGQISLWSNTYTNASGRISAQGGMQGGDGGFIETSSHYILNVGNLLVDTSAPAGATGEWLLDPWNVTISSSSTSGGAFDGGSPTNTFTPTAAANVLNTDIETNLASTNVDITTFGAGSDAGDITVSAPISWSSTNSLTLTANHNIYINAAITTGAAGSSLILKPYVNATQTAAIGGSGSLVMTGLVNSSITTLSMTNTYSGTTVNNGTLITQTNDALGSGDVTVNSGGTLQLGNTTGVTIANNLNLSGGGCSTICTGALQGTGTGSDIVTGNITLSGSTTFIGPVNSTDVLDLRGTITGSASNGIFWESLNGGTVIVRGDSGALFAGTSSLDLALGNLEVDNNNALGTGNIVLYSGYLSAVSTPITLGNNYENSNFYLNQSGVNGSVNLTLNGTGTMDSGNTFAITNTATTTLGGNVTSSGKISIDVGSGGMVIFSGTNNSGYSGRTTLTSGTLQIGTATNSLGTGSVVLNGGNLQSSLAATLVNNFTVSGTVGINGSSDITLGDNAGHNISLSSGTLTDSNNANTTFAGNLSGSAALDVTAGTTTFSGTNTSYSGTITVGSSGTLAVNTSDIGSASLILNSGTVTSSGTSSLGGSITLGTSSTDSITANGALTISADINGQTDGDGALTLQGSGSYILSGVIGNLHPIDSLTDSTDTTINGGAITTANNQTYNSSITLGADTTFSTTSTGTVSLNLNSGISGNKNVILQSNNTSANESFILGGTLAVNNVTATGGAAANSSLTINTSIAENWDISSADAGSVSGISGVGGTFNFSRIGNLTGGSASNTFAFADNASLSGSINGGSGSLSTDTNTLDFSAYTTPVTVNMPSTIYDGTALNSSSGTITTYTNINYLKANPNVKNLFTQPSGKVVTVTATLNSVINTRVGYIGDPTDFYGFYYPYTPPPTLTPTTSTSSSSTNVAQVVQQPTTNNTINASGENTSVITNQTSIAQNITDIDVQFEQTYIDDLNNTRINPNCGRAN